ncbi:uncharacterized protein [Haliotis cracherodii]|uniref:uncharacterized protein n=1 Tax=Haliotis cracherodii TaxID=6455 RepID=UPI0039E8747F
MADIQGKIFFVYTHEGNEDSPPSCTEKYDEEKGLDENFSEVFGVLTGDGYHWCHDNLGDGAAADDYENLQCRLEVWDVQTRNTRLEELDLSADDILSSDIYEVRSKPLVLHDGVTINVPVNIPKSYVPPGEMYDFYLKVIENGEWVFVPAVYKHGCARAHLDSLQLLTVVARLKPERTIITPEGVEFVSDKDPDVKIEFPKGAVAEDAEFRFVTETVDPTRSFEYRNYNPNTFQSIMGFSTTVNIEHNLKGELQTGAKVTLPIHECNDDDDGDGDVVFLRWHDGKVDIVDDVPTKEEGCYSINVKGFSAYSAVRVRSASVSRSEILTAARFLSGRENLCTLLCFINNKALVGLPVLLVDVVESCRADVVAEEHKRAGLEEISMSRSRDIPVADRERIRIELSGDITYAPGIPRQAYALVFVKAAKKNHVTFPMKVKVSSTPFSIITFIGNRSQWTHRVHFNVNRGTKSSKNLLSQPRQRLGSALSRSGSALPRSGSSQSRSGSATGSVQSEGKRRPTNTMVGRPDVPDRRQRLVSCSSVSSAETASMMSSLASLSSISEDGVFEEKRHPALCEKSLLVLSEQLPWSEWQKTAIELGMTLTQVERISEEASGRHISPAFRMFHKWIATNSGKSDCDLINDLACAFREFSRNDLADVLIAAEKDRLPLRRRDFHN